MSLAPDVRRALLVLAILAPFAAATGAFFAALHSADPPDARSAQLPPPPSGLLLSPAPAIRTSADRGVAAPSATSPTTPPASSEPVTTTTAPPTPTSSVEPQPTSTTPPPATSSADPTTEVTDEPELLGVPWQRSAVP